MINEEASIFITELIMVDSSKSILLEKCHNMIFLNIIVHNSDYINGKNFNCNFLQLNKLKIISQFYLCIGVPLLKSISRTIDSGLDGR